MKTLGNIELPGLKRLPSGKVRDMYDLGDAILMIASDRISVFDVVLPTLIPDKGRVLTGLSAFWFEATQSIVPNHVITADVSEYPAALQPHAELLVGRSMLVKKAKPLAVEAVVRGYLAGSGWKDYQRTGEICGIKLPGSLRESEQLPEPIFSPATKAASGHDENITEEQAASMIGADVLAKVKDASFRIYSAASRYARERRIIIADTKFEFGLVDGEPILIDEILTPDSSRFWDVDLYEPGKPQPSFDKQPVRDYTESTGWDKTYPGPELPPEVVRQTTARYRQAYFRLVGKRLPGKQGGGWHFEGLHLT
jgi:phosphoribosylaminoimidazole-succinocarboxamide synthase